MRKQIAEYKSRFDIDLETVKAFETIREVGLARDCGLHNEGALTEEYREQTKQRLVGEDGRIIIIPNPLCERVPRSGCRLCSFSAKDARRNRDSAVPDLLWDVSKQ